MQTNVKQYQYRARKRGEQSWTQGTINAPDKQLAFYYLQSQAYDDITVTSPKTAKTQPSRAFPCTTLSEFCKQLATLIHAGIDLVKAIEIMHHNSAANNEKIRYQQLQNKLEKGCSFSQSLKESHIMHDDFYLKFVEIGEHSGNLDYMLTQLATHISMQVRLRKKIKNAMLYPLIVLCTALVVVSFLLIFIIPQFNHLFSSLDAKLPLLTLIIIELAASLKQHAIYYISAIFLTTGAIAGLSRLRAFTHIKQKIQICTPIFGPLIRLNILTRFCHSTSVLLAAGLPLSQCLGIVANTSNYRQYQDAIGQLQDDISAGNSLANAMQLQQLWPPELVQIIDTGENSGNLETLLTHMAKNYDDKISEQIENMSTLVEPLLMLVLGLIVAFIVIAMYLPVFQMGSIL